MAAFLTNPYGLTGAFIGLFVYPYAVGAYVEGRPAWLAVPMTYGVMTAMTLANDEFIWGDIFFPGTFGVMFFLGGRAVRSRSRLDRGAARGGAARDGGARGRGRAARWPTSAAGSRARCTTSWRTPSR